MLWGCEDPPCCLVRARPRTGRYRQIRRHLQNISLPIIGDQNRRKEIREEWGRHGVEVPRRVMLHLHRVELPATACTPQIDVRCPFPPDYIEALERACPEWAPEEDAKGGLRLEPFHRCTLFTGFFRDSVFMFAGEC